MNRRRQQTIEQIRGLRTAHRIALGRTPRRGKIPAPVQPQAIRLQYMQGLQAVVLVDLGIALSKISEQVPGWVEAAQRERGDAMSRNYARDLFILDEVQARLDASVGKAHAEINRLAKEFDERASPRRLGELARQVGQRTSDYQREQLRKQLKAGLGVDALLHEPASVAARLEHFTEENVALIKSIPRKFFGEVETIVTRGVRSGDRAEEISDQLQDRYDVAESDARRVANDQVGKFFGELNHVRQEALGIDSFVWRGMLDNRERPEHQELEGQTFTWADGAPGEDAYPGDGVNCRCWAEPDLSGLLEDTE